MTEVKRAPYKVDELIAEYRHFSAFGYSDNRIADRLGLNPTHMIARLAKLGVTTNRGPSNLVLAFERAVESGEEFASDAFPDWSTSPDVRVRLIKQAVKEGRIQQVGKKTSSLGTTEKVQVWKAVA